MEWIKNLHSLKYKNLLLFLFTSFWILPNPNGGLKGEREYVALMYYLLLFGIRKVSWVWNLDWQLESSWLLLALDGPPEVCRHWCAGVSWLLLTHLGELTTGGCVRQFYFLWSFPFPWMHLEGTTKIFWESLSIGGWLSEVFLVAAPLSGRRSPWLSLGPEAWVELFNFPKLQLGVGLMGPW